MATEKVYSDLPLNFTPNPISGDVVPLSDERAVKQSLRNLLLTPIGSKPFYPEYGTDLYKFLFDLGDSITESEINEEIAATIQRFEPRARLVAIETSVEDEEVNIKIDYYVVNVPGLQTLETTVARTA